MNIAGRDDLRQLQKLSTPVWIFDVDRHGIWWANAQGLAFWKAESVQELQKRDFSSDSATVQERLRQIVELASDDSHVTDTWTLYPTGSPQTVILSFQPVEIENRFKGVLIELLQVLDRDADNDTWRLLEAARATSLMMTTYSLDGELLAQNPASLECYGALAGLEGEQTNLEARFVHPADAARVLQNAAANKTTKWEAEVVTAAGVRTHSLSVRKGRDPITGDFVTVLSEEDVTERVKLRRLQESEKEALKQEVAQSYDKLRVSQERYELAVQTAAIWDWDVVADKLFMSPNLVNALGYTEAEFVEILRNQRLIGFLHPDDVADYEAKIEDHLANPEKPLSHEVRFLTKSGDILWFHCQGKCVHDGRGNVTRSAGLLTDVTQRKNLEATLLVSQRMEAVGQLTGGIAHDFNNLLTVIQGNAELLAEIEQSHTELTDEIVSAVRRGADLTKHLLAFARQQTLIPHPVNLNQLIPEMEKTLLRTISETVTINFHAPDDLWDVHVDQTQLETAILNLALNARDAMKAGGTVEITCSNKPFSEITRPQDLELDVADYVEISVTDSGDGMSGEQLSKAFEPFFTTKEVGQGSGLGLSMVQGFSRQSKGDARINSQLGRGTTVSLYLPKSRQLPSQVVKHPKAEVALGNREHVHIVEDNHHVQQTVSKLVGSLGYEVTTSNDVSQALTWIEENPSADLYLVDVLLPGGKSGVDFARSLQRVQPDAKILFMSGYSENHGIGQTSQDLGTGFISKPFDKSRFSKAIGSALVGQRHAHNKM